MIMRFLRLPRRAIERLPPYPSLILVGVPFAIVEPLKLAVLFIAGSGHWITGAVTMICAYAVSFFVGERLFVIVKPKLLTLRWFAACWRTFVSLRSTTINALLRLFAGMRNRAKPKRSRARVRRSGG